MEQKVNDPLAMPARMFETPLRLALDNSNEPDLFLDGDRFMTHLNQYGAVDVMTYSCSKAFNAPLHNVDRLIYGIRQRGSCIRPRQKKFMLNNHVKLFLCYNGGSLVDVFVGSQNLTHGTNLNLMYRVRDEHKTILQAFFEKIWKNL